jgi:DNA uptake protein ComE-like DNA-binding protein
MSKEQLLEVYGMDSARYLPIRKNLFVDTVNRNRININKADFKTLLRHPYLNKNQVRAIVNYRKQHGDFKRVEDIERIHLLKGEPYRKIAPYFTVQ